VTRLIVTDLDGTLIDHHTYSAVSAQPALAAARRLGVPIVLCSSKTYAEMSSLGRVLSLQPAPLIVENGGAVWFPGEWPLLPVGAVTGDAGGWVVVLGATAAALQPLLHEVAGATHTTLRGFSSMTDEEVAERTGLALDVAALARQRQYSEPFVCVEGDGDLAVLDAAARSIGARVTRGGRFFHLTGDADKGRAVRLVRGTCPALERVLGLGDAPNDIALLREADDAVIVPQPTGVHPDVVAAMPGARVATAAGPAGWNAAVLDWLDDGAGR
jgi:mannosyl-3-phosphoglycerate phosphatase